MAAFMESGEVERPRPRALAEGILPRRNARAARRSAEAYLQKVDACLSGSVDEGVEEPIRE